MPPNNQPLPLSARKADSLYFYFFCHMVPIMLFVDSAPYIPTAYLPLPMSLVKSFYEENFSDPLQETKPMWYLTFAASEFLIQLPIGIWALTALKRNDPLVPLGLGVYAALAAFTTWVSVAELWAWPEKVVVGSGVVVGLEWEKKVKLVPLYAIYGVIFTIMAFDMASRIKSKLLVASELEAKKLKGK